MKINLRVSWMIALTILILSCTGANQTIDQVSEIYEPNKDEVGINEDSLINPINYSADWDAFKVAASDKNEEGMKRLCTDNITDFEGVFFLLNDLFVRRKLDETIFSDLERDADFPDMNYLRFYAEDIGMDEFGYEYASAITLYFLKTPDGLRLDRYSAAG